MLGAGGRLATQHDKNNMIGWMKGALVIKAFDYKYLKYLVTRGYTYTLQPFNYLLLQSDIPQNIEHL